MFGLVRLLSCVVSLFAFHVFVLCVFGILAFYGHLSCTSRCTRLRCLHTLSKCLYHAQCNYSNIFKDP